MEAYENNAEYNFNENAIHVAAAAISEPFFREDFPDAWNFGALGYTVGHELTHSIDTLGSSFDSNGNIVHDWWSETTKDQFRRRAFCLLKQYATINDSFVESKHSLDTKRTLDENVADNGGIQVAYRVGFN